MRPAVYGRLTRVTRHDNLSGAGPLVSSRICHTEEDRVDATIPVALAFGSQLNRLAVGGDDDVVQRITVTITVLDLIAGHLGDHHAADWDGAIAVVLDTSHQVRRGEGLILVIRWPHALGRSERERRGFIVHHRYSLRALRIVTRIVSGPPGDGGRSFRIRRVHGLAIAPRTGDCRSAVTVVRCRCLARV